MDILLGRILVGHLEGLVPPLFAQNRQLFVKDVCS